MGATAAMPTKKQAKKDEKEESIPTKLYASDNASLRKIALYLSLEYKREVSIAEAFRVSCGDQLDSFAKTATRNMANDAEARASGS